MLTRFTAAFPSLCAVAIGGGLAAVPLIGRVQSIVRSDRFGKEFWAKWGALAGSDEARKIRALFSARGGAWGGGWPSNTELVHHFTGLDQAQLLTGDSLDPRRIVTEGLDLPGEISVDLSEPCDLPMLFGLGLAHLINLDEAPVPAHRENQDQNGEESHEDESPFASSPGLGQFLLSAEDHPSRLHVYSVAPS